MDPAQTLRDLATRQGYDIREVMQEILREEIATWEIPASAEPVNAEENGNTEMELADLAPFLPVLKALKKKDWEGVRKFIDDNPRALIPKISSSGGTILHLMIRSDAPVWLLESLLVISEMQMCHASEPSDVRMSAIFSAAKYGNTKVAEAFVRGNKDLPNATNHKDLLPIHVAALYGHKETVEYLLTVTSTSLLNSDKGVQLLGYLINCGLYGIAFDLLKQFPKLACDQSEDTGNILEKLANKPLAFESGCRLGHWERLIYHGIPVKEEHDIPGPGSEGGDIEKPMERSENLTKSGYLPQISAALIGTLFQKLNIMLWNAVMQLAPRIKRIQEAKLTHMQTHEIVRMIRKGVLWDRDTSKSLEKPLLTAARLGTYEIVDEILKAYFYAFKFENECGNFINLAVIYRQEKVFSLASDYAWTFAVAKLIKPFDNVLHLAGKLTTSSQIPGAALQMQRELQWFKAVENFLHPSYQEHQNTNGETPRQVFTNQHKELVKEGEKWMKETAQSCTVVAALIITVVFTAAFTVPGGSDSRGVPNFLHELAFIVFAIADAFALFFSTTSVLMFLGILTSRYAEEDFLESLPKKLIIGLITLFLSIASMMIAFGAAIYIVLSYLWSMVFIPIAILGGLTVILFVKMQFPLLVEMYLSTYRSSLYQPKKVRL